MEQSAAAILTIPSEFDLRLPGEDKGLLRVNADVFKLESAGVYSLEGPNGSGKSILIRLLTGALPSVFEPVDLSVMMSGKRIDLRSTVDALAAGIVAVHQDDSLISSLTIFEHILLRHGRPRLADFVGYLWNWVGHHAFLPFRALGRSIPDGVSEALEKAKPQFVDWQGNHALKQRALEVLKTHDVPEKLLNAKPTVLSGGFKAAARLVCAQLYTTTRVLVLDEALSGVSANRWPGYVEAIKKWAATKGIAILVVSHVREELDRWQPVKRFVIEPSVSSPEVVATLRAVEGHAPLRTRSEDDATYDRFRVYKVIDGGVRPDLGSWWRDSGVTDIVAVIESETEKTAEWKRFTRACPATPIVIDLKTDDIKDDAMGYWRMLQRVETTAGAQPYALIVAGGTAVTNFGLMLGGTVSNRSKATVVLPTSPSAMFRVVSRLPATVSYTVNGAGRPAEASVSTDDAVVVIDPDFLRGAGREEYDEALARCIRAGLTLDQDLYASALASLQKSIMNSAELVDLLSRWGEGIRDMRLIDRDGKVTRRLFDVAELHRRALSILLGDTVHARECILLALLLELIICDGSSEILQSLAAAAKPFAERFREWSGSMRLNDVSRVYADLTGNAVAGIQIREIGEFAMRKHRTELLRTAPLADLRAYWENQVNSSVKRVPVARAEAAFVQLRDLMASS